MSRKTRKLMWSVPMIAAVAVIGALALFVALSPNGAQADHVDLPGIVTGVMAEADGRDSVDVKWTAPTTGGTPDYYRIDRSGDGDNWMRLVQMHTDGLSYTDMMGLKPNKNYHYRVFVVNAAGTGPSSDLTAHSMTTTDDAVKPGPVRMLTAEVDGPNQVNLSWYPPEDNGGSSITRYCISTAMGTADDTGTGTMLPTDDSNARDLGGTGLPCAHDTPPRAYALPSGDPDTGAGHLSAIAAGTSSGVIVIRAPEDGGMASYMHTELPSETSRRYEVYAVNSKGISTTARAVAPIPETDDADKPASPTLRLVPLGTTTGNVFTPNGSASLYWTWPDDGGKDIESWQLQREIDGGEWTDVGTATPHVSEDDLEDTRTLNGPEFGVAGTDLLPTVADADDTSNSKTTRYRVRAYNGSSGAWSNEASITITSTWDAAANNAVVSTPSTGAVAGLKVSSGEHLRQIDLSWTDQRGTAYLIDYAEVEDDTPADDSDRDWMALQPSTGYTKATYNHSSGLDPGVQRHYRVTSLKSGVYGPIMVMNGSTKAAAKAAAVEGLKTSSDDPTMIMLEWTKPSEDGGQPITGYRVETGLDDTFPETDEIAVTHMSESCDDIPAADADPGPDAYVCVREVMGADTTTFTLGGLDAGDDRWFRVFAINKVFTADDNEPDADDARLADPIKGTSAKSGTPGMPLDLTVQPARDANEDDPTKLGIDILWNAPDDPAGDSVTAYVIARRTKDSTDADWSAWDDDWASISNEGSDFLRTYDTDTNEPDNLANGEMREYKVTAMSGAGSGPTTAAVVYPVDTSHTGVAAGDLGTPSQPRPRVVTVGGIKTISILWDSGEGEERQIVQLLTEDRMFVDSQTVMPDGESADFDNDGSGVAPGTYRVQVVALGMGTDFRNSGTVLVTVE